MSYVKSRKDDRPAGDDARAPTRRRRRRSRWRGPSMPRAWMDDTDRRRRRSRRRAPCPRRQRRGRGRRRCVWYVLSRGTMDCRSTGRHDHVRRGKRALQQSAVRARARGRATRTVWALGARQPAPQRGRGASARRDHRASSRKFLSSALPCGVITDSGWNCTPYTGMLAVLHAVHLARIVLRDGDDLEASGIVLALDDQRVVAHDFHRRRQAGEHAGSVVADLRRLAVHDAIGADDVAAVRFADRLMAEADAEDRDRASPAADDVDGDAGFLRRARPGREHDRRRRQRRRCRRR